jgi:hypothetical protein
MIFARRTIQRFIDFLEITLPKSAILKIVHQLNQNNRSSLDFEWELSILFALSKLGFVGYEIEHGGTRYPDITFSHLKTSDVDFIAEVACVSDRGLEEENPTRLFLELLRGKIKFLDLPGGFQYQIGGAPDVIPNFSSSLH